VDLILRLARFRYSYPIGGLAALDGAEPAVTIAAWLICLPK